MTEVVISGADRPAEQLTTLLERGNPADIADFFEGMPEKERRTFVRPLREQLKTVTWRAFTNDPDATDWNGFRRRQQRVVRAQVPAALAVLGGPAAIAKYLRSLQNQSVLEPDPDIVRRVLTDRNPDWLAQLPDELSAALEPRGLWLVTAVAELAGVVPTASPEYVRAWALQYRWRGIELADDPRAAELLPLTFDDDENDELFGDWGDFRTLALEAVERGSVARGEVLDASLRRLLRGGRTGVMQHHLAFWSGLKPTDEEIAERISICISLLSSQSGTVARVFLASVKKVCDAGLADLELALEAASIAVTRSEKNVVKTALSWLDALATANTDRVAQVARIVATAFGAQAADLQERAVKLIGKRAGALALGDRQRLVAEAAVYLAPDLASRLAESLGTEQDAAMADVGYPDVAAYVPRPLLVPIGSPAELAEVVASLLHGDPAEAMVFERVLEAFVAFARTDAAALSEALTPVVERQRPTWEWALENYPQTPRVALFRLAEAAVEPEEKRHPHRAGVHQLWGRVRKQKAGYASQRTRTSPADVLILRAAEIRFALGLPDMPPLVCLPTAATGIIEPEVLAARLRECESKGWVPLQADFHQALLRLPADCGDVDTTGFASDAGRRFSAWVAGERIALPAAEPSDPREHGRSLHWHWHNKNDPYLDRVRRMHATHPKTLLELVSGGWTEPEQQHDGSEWDVCWPAILPTRPDLPALSLAGGWIWNTARPSPESAIALAEQDDPIHAGTHHVIAARLVHEEAPMRASGVDAALILAARGLLDARRLAAALSGRLAAEPTTGIRRMAPCLRDLANGGAAGQTWETIAALLPEILPPAVPRTMAGTADVLVVGTELAGALKVRAPISAVTALAEKKGGTVVANAARRLAGVLAAG